MNEAELKKAEKKYGTVNFKGKKYILTDQAQMCNYGTDGDVRYYADGVDPVNLDNVQVAWETTAEWDNIGKAYGLAESINYKRSHNEDAYDDELELADLLELMGYDKDMDIDDVLQMYPNDESDACDWDSPVDVSYID